MKQYIKKLSMVLVVMAFALIVAMTVPTEAKAAFKSSPQGKVTKCGSYYIKRNKTGIYKSKKKTSGFKLVVKAATSTAKDRGKYAYGFTSDGTTIYYAVNDNKTNKGNIYSIKATGKSKKTIYKAKHQVNVYYAYGGKIIYKSDVYGRKNFEDDYMYCLNPKSTAKTKYTKICDTVVPYDATGSSIVCDGIKSFIGKYAVIISSNWDNENSISVWDIEKMKEYSIGRTDCGYPDDYSRLYYIKDGYFYYIRQYFDDATSDENHSLIVVKIKIGSTKESFVTSEYSGWYESLKPGKLIYKDKKGKTHTVTF